MVHHHRHGQPERLTSLNSTYFIVIALNMSFVVVEALVGYFYNSVGLLSDAGHKFADVFYLIIALIAFKLTRSKPSKRFTFGLRKTSVLIALFNAFILLVAVVIIMIKSIEKLSNPLEVSGAAMSWTAGVGIVVSGLSAILMLKHQKGDINTRGAFLHMVTDSLLSLGVVISGIIISVSGWNYIDPLISLVVAAVILFNTLKLLRESFLMSIDAVPQDYDYEQIREIIISTDGVKAVDELHIWALSVFDTALCAHVKINSGVSQNEILTSLHSKLAELGIASATIECMEEV